MSAEIKKAAREYPGSYRLGVSGKFKTNGVMVTFIAYTNPNNVTGACYINYMIKGVSKGLVVYNLDIYNIEKVKENLRNEIGGIVGGK
jgi:hypothetical protein